jgi:putative tryptophan/tyrosine transport system substrate-binding protein
MKRREFITLLGGAAAAWPLAARAQQPAMPVIGWLSSRSAATDALVLPAFHRALNAQGFVEGRNVTVEYRHADAQLDRLPALAADLVSRRAALLVVIGDSARGLRAVQAASNTISILMFVSNETIKDGFVASINRPGGNVTGVMNYQRLVVGKRMGLLHDLLPRAAGIAVLNQPNREGAEQEISDVQEAARSLALQTTIVNAQTPSDIDTAFASFAQQRPDVLFVTTSPLFFTRMNQIVTATVRLALPTSFFRREFVAAGGLMSYASSPTDSYRVLGEYAGRIIKGEKPANLPVQQPTKFELVLNLITAKALGLTVPTSMLLLADDVIE